MNISNSALAVSYTHLDVYKRQAYPQMLAAIREAKEQVFLCTYIFNAGKVATEMCIRDGKKAIMQELEKAPQPEQNAKAAPAAGENATAAPAAGENASGKSAGKAAKPKAPASKTR